MVVSRDFNCSVHVSVVRAGVELLIILILLKIKCFVKRNMGFDFEAFLKVLNLDQ